MTWTKVRNEFLLSTDKNKFQLDRIQTFLSQTYWAHHRSSEAIKASVENSMAFGLYKADTQIGLARVITDFASIAYLADVFVTQDHRGQGLGRWMLEELFNHSDLEKIELWYLGTRDQHRLYERFGFTSPKYPERQMEWRRNRPAETIG